jgi:hypothetical protein
MRTSPGQAMFVWTLRVQVGVPNLLCVGVYDEHRLRVNMYSVCVVHVCL